MSDRLIRAFVDRIEGRIAVLMIEEECVDMPLSFLPDGTKEGDVLTLTFRYEPDLTQEAADSTMEMIRQLKADNRKES